MGIQDGAVLGKCDWDENGQDSESFGHENGFASQTQKGKLRKHVF